MNRRFFSVALALLGLSLSGRAATVSPVPPAQVSTVTVVATDPVAAESGPSTGLFTVRRIGPTTNSLTVFYQTSGTAVAPGDYLPLPGSIVIPAGSASAGILLTPIDDNIIEGDETVVLTLVSPPQPVASPTSTATEYQIGKPASATITIKDNDSGVVSMPTVSIRATVPDAVGTAKPGKITISRLGDSSGELIVNYSIVTDPIPLPSSTGAAVPPIVLIPAATPAVDYQALSGTITIPPGERSVAIVVQPISDNLPGVPKHVTLKLTTNKAYNINQPDSASVILNNPVSVPTVSLTKPVEGATFTAPADITLSAEASETGGGIQKVDFLAGGKIIGSVAGPLASGVFTLTWKAVSAGTYTLQANATDLKGQSSFSKVVHIAVGQGTNIPPTVSLSSPKNGQTFTAPADIQIAAEASDPDDSVAKVEFFANSKSIGVVTSKPFQMTWKGVAAGDYKLTAQATDSRGVSQSSAPVAISVTEKVLTFDLISAGSVWKYLDDGSDQGTAWRQPSFDDSKWASGPAPLGYGSGKPATVVGFGSDPNNRHITTYFRRSFEVKDLTTITGLLERVLRVDGAIAYLNGTQVSHGNMPSGTITNKTLASRVLTGTSESTWHEATLDPKLLVSGNNVMAVEVHKGSVTNADMIFDLELTARQSLVTTPQASLFIDTPKDGAAFVDPADIVIGATAIDPKGYISEVAFFANDKQIGVSRLMFFQAPAPGTPIHHTLEWNNVPAGKYSITAQAKDASGADVVSPPVTVMVAAPSPTVLAGTLVQPANGAPGYRVSFQGEPGQRYSIQVSSDLQDWTEVGLVESAGGTIEFVDPAGGLLPLRFYRVLPAR
jgi:hypothetical protein